MTTAKKTTASKTGKAVAQQPDVELPVEAKVAPSVPGDDATADELAYFIHHNPVYRTLPTEERDAFTKRLIEAKRQS